jgi:hypothetical protein
MKGELECEGSVKLGPLPWEISERLAQFSGNWLEFAPAENAIIVRKSLPVGCPPTTAVSCELITMIESLPAELREAIPGGEIFVRASGGRIMRFAVGRGEIRIQWPTEDYSRPIGVPPEIALKSLDASEARVRGWARFAGSRVSDIRMFTERFGGLYPEGDLPSECVQNIAYVPFKDVSVDPEELISRLQRLAEPPETLQAELEVTSAAPRSTDRDFRILVQNGKVTALRPTLWK